MKGQLCTCSRVKGQHLTTTCANLVPFPHNAFGGMHVLEFCVYCQRVRVEERMQG